VNDPLPELLALARFLTQRHSLEEVLSEVAARAAAVVGVPRASVRVLDPQRERLVATARAGEPVHTESAPFALGEGLLGWVAAHERSLRLDDAESDPRFVPRPGALMSIRGFLAVPMIAGGGCVGVLSFADPRVGAFDTVAEERAMLVAAICAPHVEMARLAKLTQLDALTGLLNRRGLDHELETPREMPTAVIVVDVDHFKKVNDTHGHAVGDRALRVVADVLTAVVRRADSVARYGGEEFVLVLRGASPASAVAIAERARARLEATPVAIAGGSVPVTASFGVAMLAAGERIERAFSRADAAMYEAKRAGRNCVKVAEPEERA
jgi:diguanylate cyclase (GGDEF)-like protein